ncbi:MAG: 30S ribosomal protein S11 [Patescibacteria group bacterium]
MSEDTKNKIVAEKSEVGVKPETTKRAKRKRQVSRGIAHIQASYNNTIVTLSDQNGNVIAYSSAGHVGFKGPKKATPYAAGIVVKNAVEKARMYGLKEVDARVKGVGVSREAAVRALYANGLVVLSIKDLTPTPHNGCRPPRPRRV